jgi:lipopolysaccharide heptosyltransferase I
MTPSAFPSPPRRILIIKPSAIGDVVHALPVLNLLRRRWPEARVSWLVTPACAGLLEGHPQLDEVIHFERREFGRGWRSPRVAVELLRFMVGLRRRRFDLVIDLQGLFRSGWFAASTRAPRRVGPANAREGAWLFYTHRVATGPPEQHAIERYLTIAEAVGCERGPVEFHFAVDDADRAAVAAMTPPRYAVLMPGANWLTKQWPVERFASLVAPLRERFGLESVVAGGPDTVALAAQIPRAVDLAGRTNLRQLVALLERAALVVANDSGPMHIAAALGRPLVTPFGPTNPVRTGPYRRIDSVVRVDIPCSPCYSRRCSHVSCLRWVGVESVLELAERQMNDDAPQVAVTLARVE